MMATHNLGTDAICVKFSLSGAAPRPSPSARAVSAPRRRSAGASGHACEAEGEEEQHLAGSTPPRRLGWLVAALRARALRNAQEHGRTARRGRLALSNI